VYGLLWCSMPV